VAAKSKANSGRWPTPGYHPLKLEKENLRQSISSNLREFKER